MLEDSVSSTWESMANWFTPTVLFLLLNLMIATIAFTSSLAAKSSTADNAPRSAKYSLLHRLKSGNLQQKQIFDSDPFFDGIESHTHYLFQHNTTVDTVFQSDSQIQPEPQIQPDLGLENQEPLIENEAGTETETAGFDSAVEESKVGGETLSEIYNQVMEGQIESSRSEEEPKPEANKVKMRKSASLRFDFRHLGEEKREDDGLEARRPATVRVKSSTRTGGEGDEEVDARADDFINKFKHQLKLQRLDSLNRGGIKM